MAHGPIPSGLMVALALQFDATTLDPVTIKVIN
jgi:hypothetical protein